MPDQIPPTPGARILCRDAEWLVTRVEISDYAAPHFAVHCIGVDDLVRGHESIFLTQLEQIELVDPRHTKLVEDRSNGYRLSKLFLEAQLRQMPATGVEPDLIGMGVFTPMAFQQETVRRALLQLRPRLLLADAVGLGKTIQVGMILTELLRRGRGDRILVLAKKSMLTQFQAELWNRFNIPLVRLDSAGIAKLRLRIPGNKNPFEVYHRVIISLDTLKNVARYEHFLKDTRWDVVIIDEAHNVAGASVPERHLSYRLARLLARRTDSLLLTTATPHNGRRETFGRLIALLDPSAIPDPNLKEYTARDIKPFFLMRFKEDIRKDAAGMLAERQVVPLPETTANATPDEEMVYEALAELRQAVLTALQQDGHTQHAWQHHTLVQYGFYKLFLSSPEACLATINKQLQTVQQSGLPNPALPYLERLKNRLEGLSITQTSRYEVLQRQLRAIGWGGSADSPRVLIFTEYRRTQEALAAALARAFTLDYSARFEAQPHQVIATIHGGCPDVHLMKTVEAFATGSSSVRLLLATDVASEGINLHHECHHIIHYDLPWSIITLIQRNGRIDRLGQTRPPILRYLMVNTSQGLLQGDKAIFERLIDKVEVINRLRQSGESVLQLYDPQAEEEYVATHGILAGNVGVLDTPASITTVESTDLEAMLSQASLEGHDDFLRFLRGQDTGEAEAYEVSPHTTNPPGRLRLYADRQFLLEGYRYLAEQHPHYLPIQEVEKLIILTAPKDLKRRLGAPDERGDIIFGATAIPEEAWPAYDQFRLTDDPERVELAIQAARQTSGYWSQELLCSEQHPILKWLTERLVMQIRRGEAPLILSRSLQPGELCFCFIGQVSSKAGTPLIVDAHAISFHRGGNFAHRPLREALAAAQFAQLINTGQMPNLQAAQVLIPAAVEASLHYMRQLRVEREHELRPLLQQEEERLQEWGKRRRELLEGRIATLGHDHPQSRRFRRDLDEMEDYLRDRQQHWRDTHFLAAAEPSTRLILVIGGSQA
jgi:ERCC4-related helicase